MSTDKQTIKKLIIGLVVVYIVIGIIGVSIQNNILLTVSVLMGLGTIGVINTYIRIVCRYTDRDVEVDNKQDTKDTNINQLEIPFE